MYVSVEMTQNTLAAGLRLAADREEPIDRVFSALLEDIVKRMDEALHTVDLDPVVAEAVVAARNIAAMSEFTLFDVCERNWWLASSPGDRKQLGKVFRRAVETAGVATWLRRRSDNHAVYRRS